MKQSAVFRFLTVLPLLAAPAVLAAGLNDSGIRTCSDGDSNGLPCPVTGFPKQDAEHGRDTSAVTGTASKIGGGDAGFDFTKLDANGGELPATATNHACVRDNVTGLTWEIKTNDGRLRDQDWIYTWRDSNSTYGDTTRLNSGICYKDEARVCDTEHFVQDVNRVGLCGFNDWRMPTIKELVGSAHYGRYQPAIDSYYFPNTFNAQFWSGSPDARNSHSAWYLDFTRGDLNSDSRDNAYHVRLVRGQPSLDDFIDNNNGTVTQVNTGLMWAKCSAGQEVFNCAGDATLMDWRTALTAATTTRLNGFSDWRLPNVKELQSLMDYTRDDSAIDTGFFPNTPTTWFWSNSPDAFHVNGAWVMDFGYGNSKDSGHVRDNLAHVRFVRNDTHIPLTITQAGSGSGTITSTDGSINCSTTTCSANFNPGSSVVLNAVANSTSSFSGWNGGGCAGIGSCTVIVNAAQTITANFNLVPAQNQRLIMSISGAGSVSSNPPGITCPGDCDEAYTAGTVVTLSATPEAGNTLIGWGDACSGTGSCRVTLNASTAVTAQFDHASARVADRSSLDWQVTELYIATLGYAPDNQGLQYWVNELRNGGWTITQVAQSFFDQPLVQAVYPATDSNDTLIDTLYEHLFGRAADPEGKTYWLGELESGAVTRNQMLISLINGGWANSAAATDMQRFGNRVQVGLAFAEQQAQRGIIYRDLSDDKQAELRRIGAQVLANVTDDIETRDAAIESIAGLLNRF